MSFAGVADKSETIGPPQKTPDLGKSQKTVRKGIPKGEAK